MILIRYKFHLLILLLILSNSIVAQDKDERIEFEKALYFYKLGDFNSAAERFNKLVENNGIYSEESHYILAASLYYLNRYEDALNEISSFLKRYPVSKYLYDVLSTQCIIYLQKKEIIEAENSLKSLSELNLSSEEFDKLIPLMNEVTKSLNFSHIEKSFEQFNNKLFREYFLEILFQRAIDMKDKTKIKEIYLKLIGLQQERNLRANFNIGVILPLNLSSEKVNPGNEILEGLKFVVDQYNHEHDNQIGLIIKDSESENKSISAIIKELVKDPTIICVVGPIYSEAVKEIAQFAEIYGIPIVTPTATSAGLTNLSNFIFQFNPTLEMRGFAMAEYVINKLGLRRIAVLTPSGGYAKEISNSFIRKAKMLGIELLIEEMYDEKALNLMNSLLSLRQHAIEIDRMIKFSLDISSLQENKLRRLGLTREFIDSAKAKNNVYSIFELFGKFGDKLCESEGIKTFNRDPLDVSNLEKPLYSIDGLLIAISDHKSISKIASQVNSFNLRTRLFGSDAWYSNEDLLNAFPSTDGLIFTSDYYLDENNSSIKYLKDIFGDLVEIPLSRNVFYGIETMRKIISSLDDKNINRFNFAERIIKDKSNNGLTTQIVLNSKRINTFLNILQYSNRSVEKIDEIKITD